MRWIKEHKLITVIIGFILFAILSLAISFGAYKSGGNVPGFMNFIFSKIDGKSVDAGNSASDATEGIFSGRELAKKNKELTEEVNKLKSELNSNKFKSHELKELKELAKSLNYKFMEDERKYVTADITDMDGTNWTNIFTINAGSNDGIKVGSIVLAGEGLVGRVYSVGKSWSKVMTLTDESTKVSFRDLNNMDMLGITTGVSRGKLSGYMLQNDSKVDEGDEIITSGMGNYPEGIKIGKITKVVRDGDKQLTNVEIKPTVDFGGLSKVTVVI